MQEFAALATALRKYPHIRENRLAADRIDGLVGTPPEVRIQPGETWADAALAELAALPPARQVAWGALLAHCGGGATAGKPTGKWMKEAAHRLQKAVPFPEFKGCMLRWMPADAKGGVFLPFEGDRLLSIVISKAFMLAADTKITDPTIVSQIKR